jgi:hypothetical protein
MDLKEVLGELYTPEIETKLAGKKFTEDSGNTAAEIAKLTNDLKERDKQLETLKTASGPNAELKKQIEDLQAANTDAEAKYLAELKKTKLNYAIDAALTKAGAVNSKAVRALLDLGKVSLDGENLTGIDEQLKTLKDNEKWAFSESMNIAGTGGNPVQKPDIQSAGEKYKDGLTF